VGVIDYAAFLHRKSHWADAAGFEPQWLPDTLFPFQRALVEWAIHQGRAALFADCGLGKTLMQLVWAENVVRYTGRPVLVVTPLAVTYQTLREAAKFGIEITASRDGRIHPGLTVTNYERLHHFDAAAVAGVVLDESSILKAFDGVRRKLVTDFCRHLPYRLLCTATAAPNDYVELGTSSEALGFLGHMDMLSRFFVNDPRIPFRLTMDGGIWRFKRHATQPFWRWVASWARAIRTPSDLGFSDEGFTLPPLTKRETLVAARAPRPDLLFDLPAVGLHEQRDERRRTLDERCERAADLLLGSDPAVAWCHLNPEGDRLAALVIDAEQVSGADDNDRKEAKLLAFSRGDVRVLITKPKIGAWGLNWQHCARMTMFPSHSYEQYYQAIRRCWRFGQTRPVVVNVVLTEGERAVMANLQRKAAASDQMFTALVAHMREAEAVVRDERMIEPEVPAWL
jgi:hypothetical protein